LRLFSGALPPGAVLECGMGDVRRERVMGIEELLKAKREEILQIAAQHGAYNVRVFGSVARGDALPDSDVDFLVDLEPGRSLLDLGGLLVDLQELLARNVDVITERGLRDRIRDRVLKEATAL
jgi:predicted nucleotidyltransferase